MLRVIWIDSYTTIGADTVFHFYKTHRDTLSNGTCIDTSGASWLGHEFISSNDGFDYYFNKFNDTIKIKRQADIGDTWLVGHDINGIDFRATLTQKGPINIESTTDSFQALSIQAYQNNTPVPNHYNGKELRWTKYHGWLTALDLYRFPNNVNEDAFTGAITDTGQLTRLDHFARLDMNYIDLPWKFAPGNEFIYRKRIATDEEIWHDSVITSTLLDTNTIVVYCQTNYFETHLVVNSGPPHYVSSGSSYYKTDTITKSNIPNLVRNTILPEAKSFSYYPNWDHFFADTFCNGRPIGKFFSVGMTSGMLNTTGCVNFSNGISGAGEHSYAFLYGFGIISQHDAMGIAPGYWNDLYIKDYFTYIKTQDCEWGTKINVKALSIENTETSGTFTKIYPNPIKDHLILECNYTEPTGTITLTDITGKVLYQQNGVLETNKIMMGGFAKGVYLLHVTAKHRKQAHKVVIE